MGSGTLTGWVALAILLGYIGVLIIISFFTSRNATEQSFFNANKQAPWFLVAFGMIGASLSGVTFISVPGAVAASQFSYFQMVLGYLLGYFVIATVLMPLYYKLNLVSIYSYLDERFGNYSYKSGSAFFLISRTLGSAVRLFLAVMVMQLAIFTPLGVPFWMTTLISLALIYVYTYKGGIQTIIITDTLQTFFLIASVIITLVLIMNKMEWGIADATAAIQASPHSKIFFWESTDSHYFFKDFFSGAFIAIVMTGLDQDMMQKNLTIKSIGDAQKNMFWFSIILVVVNFLFLCLGAMLYLYAEKFGVSLPEKSDKLFPMLAMENHFGIVAAVTFLLGITAATYSSADSSLTALTTAVCYDFLSIEKRDPKDQKKIRMSVHIGFVFVFFLVILYLRQANNQEIIKTVFDIASYTYGPLLGLFAYGLFTKRQVWDLMTPLFCLAGPILTWVGVDFIEAHTAYRFGFEKLMLNGGIVFFFLWVGALVKTERA